MIALGRKWPVVRALIALVAGCAPGQPPHPPYAIIGADARRGPVGSGFALDHQYLVTNAHVVRGHRSGDRVQVSSGGRVTTVSLVAISDRIDLAVLRQPDGWLDPIRPAANVSAGRLRAAGATIVDGRLEARAALGRIRPGCARLPAFGAGLLADFDGATPGFSGGPVVDAAGGLVGMLTALDRRPADAFAQSSEVRAKPVAFVLPAALVRAEAARITSGYDRGPTADCAH